VEDERIYKRRSSWKDRPMIKSVLMGLLPLALFMMPVAGTSQTVDKNLAGRPFSENNGPSPVDIHEVSTAGHPDTVTLITNGWVDVREVLGSIAEYTGLGLEIAPDVADNVNVHLVDVPLEKALSSLLDPVNVGYQIVDGVLIVYKQEFVTRWFRFDYPVTEREGRGELLVSAGSSSREQSGGGDQGGDENESHVTSTVVMNVWPQVINSLGILVLNDFEDMGGISNSTGTGAVSLSDRDGRILVINSMAGVIQVTAEWRRVRNVEGLLERMTESLKRQVAIEVKILEVTLSETDRSGIDWSSITGGDVDASLSTVEGLNNPAFSFVINGDRLTGLLEAISVQGTVKEVSTPRITTLNNQKAIVRVVTEEVFFVAQVEPALVTNGPGTNPVVEYQPQMIPVGLVLDVTPQIGQDSVITLNVHPTISNIVGEEISPNGDMAPVISVRELDTVGRISNGKTLVIAGLISEGFRDKSSGVPLLKDIPLLGYLFKRSIREKTSTELVMLLTPVILDSNKNSGGKGLNSEDSFGMRAK
jgi:MSHA biogenesis protein MshL